MLFSEYKPTDENYWRSVILFGRNVASYKFALAKTLFELAENTKDSMVLEDMAMPYAKHLCEHLKNADKQVTSASSNFLDSCRRYNQNEITEDELRNITVKKGFNNVLDAFQKHKIAAKGSKVHLFMTMIKFCGHILSKGTRRAAPSKLQAVEKWQPEMIKTITHLRGFLGLAQYYSQYVKNFAYLSYPLTEQLKGRSDKSNRKIVWNDKMKEAFEALKTSLLENAVLHIADPSKPYVIECDASQYAVGGVLSQSAEPYSDSIPLDEQKLRTVPFFFSETRGRTW